MQPLWELPGDVCSLLLVEENAVFPYGPFYQHKNSGDKIDPVNIPVQSVNTGQKAGVTRPAWLDAV